MHITELTFLNLSENELGPIQPANSMETEVFVPGAKRTGHDFEHSPG